jgi:hypothetical protein
VVKRGRPESTRGCRGWSQGRKIYAGALTTAEPRLTRHTLRRSTSDAIGDADRGRSASARCISRGPRERPHRHLETRMPNSRTDPTVKYVVSYLALYAATLSLRLHFEHFGIVEPLPVLAVAGGVERPACSWSRRSLVQIQSPRLS